MKKYKIIYADPPWRYARSKVQGAAEKHYPTMSIEELCALPVKEIADKDCILFLWATFPQLKEALQLIKAWGFTYKSVAFVWLKQNRKSPTWFYGLQSVCLYRSYRPAARQAAAARWISPHCCSGRKIDLPKYDTGLQGHRIPVNSAVVPCSRYSQGSAGKYITRRLPFCGSRRIHFSRLL